MIGYRGGRQLCSVGVRSEEAVARAAPMVALGLALLKLLIAVRLLFLVRERRRR